MTNIIVITLVVVIIPSINRLTSFTISILTTLTQTACRRIIPIWWKYRAFSFYTILL